MSLSEMLVISAGLIVGWVVVSRVISAYSRKSQEFVNGEWSDILGVSPDATSDQIDDAYDKKCRELKEQECMIMTNSEQEKAAQIQAHLDSAYRRSKTQASKT